MSFEMGLTIRSFSGCTIISIPGVARAPKSNELGTISRSSTEICTFRAWAHSDTYFFKTLASWYSTNSFMCTERLKRL